MLFSALITIIGLSLFEAVSSVDNAIINAGVLGAMSRRARRWFLFFGNQKLVEKLKTQIF